MIIIGLTGSIGMGKTTVTGQFKALGARTYNADDAVHALLGENGPAVAAVARLFPEAKEHNRINRAVLGKLVFNKPDLIRQLESILHPMVREYERRFVRACASMGVKMVVLDIPLLFETGGERRCDLSVVVSAPRFIQRQRVLARPGMTPERLNAISRLQMPDWQKRRRADVIVYTGLGKAYSFRQLQQLVKELRCHGKSHSIRKRRV